MKISNGMNKFIIYIFISIMLVLPVFAFAQATPAPRSGLVPCTNTPDPTTGIISPNNACDFNAFMALINKVINFILFSLAVPIAAIMFVYAGAKLVTSGGSTEARTKAKSIFTNALIGLVLAAAAWLIISTILFILGYDGGWIGLKIGA